MQAIKDFLNKIKWDKSLDAGDFVIYYLDNVSKKLEAVCFADIKRTEGTFIAVEKEGEETFIPMHRIREVREKDKIVWKR
jgi:uncharacterized protein (UPF0248 family)